MGPHALFAAGQHYEMVMRRREEAAAARLAGSAGLLLFLLPNHRLRRTRGAGHDVHIRQNIPESAVVEQLAEHCRR